MTHRSRPTLVGASALVVILLLPGLAGAVKQQTEDIKEWYEQVPVQQKLGLTEDQVARLAEVEESFMPRLRKLNVEKRTAYKSLMSALDRPWMPAISPRTRSKPIRRGWRRPTALTRPSPPSAGGPCAASSPRNSGEGSPKPRRRPLLWVIFRWPNAAASIWVLTARRPPLTQSNRDEAAYADPTLREMVA